MFRHTLTAEEQELSARIDDITKQISACQERIINAEGQKAVIEKYTHFDSLDRMIADEFIDYIEIGMISENAEREIHIHWKM